MAAIAMSVCFSPQGTASQLLLNGMGHYHADTRSPY
jgi:hypothetical protein